MLTSHACACCLALLLPTACTAGYADDYVAIQNALATYPLAIDSKDFGLLSSVFTVDVVANYSAPLNVLKGLAQVESVLEQAYGALTIQAQTQADVGSLALVSSQHSYTTQKIDVHGDTANSTTYYTANQFGKGVYEGQVLYSYGKYVDQLVRIHEPNETAGCLPQWRVFSRQLVYLGPNIGNVSVFT